MLDLPHPGEDEAEEGQSSGNDEPRQGGEGEEEAGETAPLTGGGGAEEEVADAAPKSEGDETEKEKQKKEGGMVSPAVSNTLAICQSTGRGRRHGRQYQRYPSQTPALPRRPYSRNHRFRTKSWTRSSNMR